jgi:hypothetical protein
LLRCAELIFEKRIILRANNGEVVRHYDCVVAKWKFGWVGELINVQVKLPLIGCAFEVLASTILE